MSVGGLSRTQPATAAVQAITNQVKSQLENRENRTFAMFQAIDYKTQVVAGIIYFIKRTLKGNVPGLRGLSPPMRLSFAVGAGGGNLARPPNLEVQYGDSTNNFTHLRIFKALPAHGGQVELQGYQMGHTRTDPITYF